MLSATCTELDAHTETTECHRHHSTESTANIHPLIGLHVQSTSFGKNLKVVNQFLQVLTALCHRHHHVHGHCIGILTKELTVISLASCNWLRWGNLVQASHEVPVRSHLRWLLDDFNEEVQLGPQNFYSTNWCFHSLSKCRVLCVGIDSNMNISNCDLLRGLRCRLNVKLNERRGRRRAIVGR